MTAIFRDNLSFDAFYRARFSQPTTLFDSKQIVDGLDDLFWDDAETSGGGTGSAYNSNQASTTLTVGATTAGTRVRQTYRYFNYQPGKSQLIVMTALLGSGATGITRRIGYFDDDNGLYFELDDSTLSVVVRGKTTGSVVNTSVTQDNWNVDKLDGTGQSKVTLDTSKSNIFFIDLEWLGVGQVRFGVFIGGEPIICHKVDHSNTLTTTNIVYMSTPNLPLRYEISNDGTGAASGLEHICSTIISEGGLQETGVFRAIGRGSSSFSVGAGADTNIYPLLSIRLRSGYEGFTVLPRDLSVLSTGNTNFEVQLLFNPTIAGSDAASWTTITNSAVEYDISRDSTNTLSGGTLLGNWFGSNTTNTIEQALQNSLILGVDLSGTVDECVIGVRKIGTQAETYYASLNWRELL